MSLQQQMSGGVFDMMVPNMTLPHQSAIGCFVPVPPCPPYPQSQVGPYVSGMCCDYGEWLNLQCIYGCSGPHSVQCIYGCSSPHSVPPPLPSLAENEGTPSVKRPSPEYAERGPPATPFPVMGNGHEESNFGGVGDDAHWYPFSEGNDGTSSYPIAASSSPVTAISNPATANSSPVTAISNPATANSSPVTAISNPATANSSPVTAISIPATANSSPVTAISIPVTANSSPVTAISIPATANSCCPVVNSSKQNSPEQQKCDVLGSRNPPLIRTLLPLIPPPPCGSTPKQDVLSQAKLAPHRPFYNSFHHVDLPVSLLGRQQLFPTFSKKNHQLCVKEVWTMHMVLLFKNFPEEWTLSARNDICVRNWSHFKDMAKVRFYCQVCHNGWTSMCGVVMFYYNLNRSLLSGQVLYEVLGQKCGTCMPIMFEMPMWYPEEAQKVITNLYYKIASSCYNLMTPRYILSRRQGKPLTHHRELLCQGCFSGTCRIDCNKDK